MPKNNQNIQEKTLKNSKKNHPQNVAWCPLSVSKATNQYIQIDMYECLYMVVRAESTLYLSVPNEIHATLHSNEKYQTHITNLDRLSMKCVSFE